MGSSYGCASGPLFPDAPKRSLRPKLSPKLSRLYHSTMLQELFRIPGLDLPIYSYGLMMVIGFLAAIQLAKYLATRSGLDPEIFINAGLLALVTGIIGARLSHVLENLP